MLWNLPQSTAQPIYALREGFSCLTCHVNPTGGRLRTKFGEGYGVRLSVPKSSEVDFSKLPGSITPQIRMGSDLRFVGQISEDPNIPSTFDLMQWNLHVGIDVSPHIQLVSRTNLATLREAYALISGIPLGIFGSGLFKVGRFPLAYGWVIPDDTSSIRGGLGFGFGNLDTGVELSLFPERTPFFLHVSATNGETTLRDANSLKALTVKLGALHHRNKMFGISYFSNTAGGIERSRFGFFDGIHLWGTTLLAEADYGRNLTLASGAVTTMLAGYLEAVRRVTPETQLRAKLDYFDPNRGVLNDEVGRMTLAAEFYPWPSFAYEVQYRLYSEIPSIPNNEWALLVRSWF